ncbi:ganglioside-induced differentiation-associated protein 1 [Lutzomyia longipalpis]|uniref:Putative ganglioside-induced differentiation-associated protein 1 n=1 Tax=Lutzomyia longipalpis TaxID=7200 RepID=A0A1B0CAU6_LUTLO|nr:ganglioside-induced differentiation-associated protein 1 [Lutzomyia longipalpis]
MCHEKVPQNIPELNVEEPVLFYHSQSFYSQKVLLVLYEKNINFLAYEVNVAAGEQYTPWFLDLNPKGEVPVLKIGSLVVPESAQIINYVERNFQQEPHRRLLPRDLMPQQEKKILRLSNLISKLPIGTISMGSFIHADFSPNPKPPFIAPVRRALVTSDRVMSNQLKCYAKDNPIYAEVLLRKSDFYARKRDIICKRDDYVKLLGRLEEILEEIENELRSHGNADWWLCSSHFTLADCCLGILLYRLYALGLEDYLWGKRPHIGAYFARLYARESFLRAIPSRISTLRTMWNKTPANYKLGVGLLSASSVIAAVLAMRK